MKKKSKVEMRKAERLELEERERSKEMKAKEEFLRNPQILEEYEKELSRRKRQRKTEPLTELEEVDVREAKEPSKASNLEKSERMDKLEKVVGGLVVGLDKSIEQRKETQGETLNELRTDIQENVDAENLLIAEIERLEKKEDGLSKKIKKEGKTPKLETGLELVELSFSQKELFQARSNNLMRMINKFSKVFI